jgi:alanyl-tRNA synthetase
MTAKQLLNKYLEFFESKGHTIVPSASLIPENDPTVLFTTAGMQPMVPYLLGEKHPGGNRIANVQKCLRTGDLEVVGDNTHHTFFQMLGNWSLGDYFREDAIKWSFEFLTSPEWLGLPLEMLGFTVYQGGNGLLQDDESFGYWESLGVAPERIAYWGEDNFWSAGATGPCGPSTEMFYWTGDGAAPAVYDPADERWVEIWNDVFMAYNKLADGTIVPLAQRNVDTGMGLERTAAVLTGKKSAYETDLFMPMIEKVVELSGKAYVDHIIPMRVIADHVRAAVFVMGDPNGVVPGNKDQGYVLRRLIRRAINAGRTLGIKNFLPTLAEIVIDIYQDPYTELVVNKEKVLSELEKEETKFGRTIEQGMKQFESVLAESNGTISGVAAFDLYQSFGFPVEMTVELAKAHGVMVDMEGFSAEQANHSEVSKQGAEEKFKGGLADHSEMSVKYHTATHLLHAALQKVLGPHAMQKGSNITPERLRFDFTHGDKMTDGEKQAVEDLVNAAITRDYQVAYQELPLEEAKKKGAVGLFDDNYGDLVKVYSIGDPDAVAVADPDSDTFSREFCGGPHVDHTGVLGHFRIVKEESCSAGVRRIKAILE